MNRRKEATILERRAGALIGASPVPGSGSLPGTEADQRLVGRVLLEHKFTRNGRYRLTRHTFDKLKVAADSAGEIPVFVIRFVPEKVELAVVETPWLTDLKLEVGIRRTIAARGASAMIGAFEYVTTALPQKGHKVLSCTVKRPGAEDLLLTVIGWPALAQAIVGWTK